MGVILLGLITEKSQIGKRVSISPLKKRWFKNWKKQREVVQRPIDETKGLKERVRKEERKTASVKDFFEGQGE